MSLTDTLNQQYIDSLSQINDDQDILDEFLDQRVYENISNNTLNFNINQDLNQDLDLHQDSITDEDLMAHDHQLENNLIKHELIDDFMNDDLSLSLNNTDYLNMSIINSNPPADDKNIDQDLNDESIYIQHDNNPYKQKSAITVGDINMDNDFQEYENARNELTKLKFGNCKLPKLNDPITLPKEYLNFDNILPYNLKISGLPSYSRVETQIKVKLSLSPPPSQFLVHLSNDLISKTKFCLTNELPESIKKNLLFLDTFVLTSENKSCNICSRCIKREQKRASRRKSGLNDENSNWDDDINKKAIIFNCKEIISFPPPNGLEVEKNLELSARIICYCRHHQESKGFKLLFVIKNYLGEIVAKNLSSSIMIMDRKKNISNFENFENFNDNSIEHENFNEQFGEKIHDTLQPLSPTSIDESSSEPHTDSRSLKRKKFSIDSSSQSLNTSGSTKNHLSPLSDSTTNIFRSPSNMSTNFMESFPNNANLPSIQRIIPAQGPIRGGIEVTLLGCNFKPGLIVKFGSHQALATHCWSDSTIVTYLPPATQPGQVLVSFENYDSNRQPVANQPAQQVFTYLDDTDRQLIELALQIVGLKMNGKLEDARNIARRIVGTDNKDSNKINESSQDQSPGSQHSSISDQDWFDNAHKTVDQLTKSNLTTEEMLLNFLSLIDLPNCPTTPNFNICTLQGQTLLHLATLKNFDSLIKFLITHGCKIDSKDNQGLTPLFYAALVGNRTLIKLFIDCKSNWNLKLTNGKSLKDYADLNVLDIFSDLENAGDNGDESFSHNSTYFNRTSQKKIAKQSSSDSLDSLFTLNYGNHVSKMVAQNYSAENLPNESSNQNCDLVDDGSGYDDDSEADAEFDDDMDSINDTRLSSSIEPEVESPNTQISDTETITQNDDDDITNRERSESSGIWQRVRNVFNNETHEDEDSLPTYDDLYPLGSPSSSKAKESTELSTQQQQEMEPIREMNETSEDIVEDFISQRKQFRHDKMLLFFWLPVLLGLISLFVFGDRLEIGEKLQEFLRSGLGAILIGNERVKDVFTNVNIAVNAVTSATVT